ncbi:bifunctional diguanylate cyclase/phosphodiesterase [Phytobacter ursingii]|uniref:EAL domain-containing protein n=1 Tax=Phytobacter ursingii TaxID=1972431 RepID=A0AB35RNG0_9ENTR|nr:EAL domain-containing protein [Phytobacter ursingii]MDV2863701.1 EAL domain-containing protein [Phytobacter ursingii]
MNWKAFTNHKRNTEQSRNLVKKTFTVIIPLLTVIFLTALVSLLSLTHDMNTARDRHDRQILKKALLYRQESIRSQVENYSDWGEAYEHLHKELDTGWAWGSQNLGESFFKVLGYEGVFILSHEGMTRYSVVDGQCDTEPLDDWTGTKITANLQRDVDANHGAAVSHLILSKQGISIVAGAAIRIGGDNNVIAVPGKPSLMVFVYRLTPAKLISLGAEYGIRNVRLAGAGDPDDDMSITLSDVNGDNAVLTWDSQNPGRALILFQLPLFIVLIILTFFLIVMMMRNLLLKAKIIDENVFLLDKTHLALAESEKRFRDVMEITTDWLWEADAHLKITWLSERFSVITGLHSQDWMGRNLTGLFPDEGEELLDWRKRQPSGASLKLTNRRYLSSRSGTYYCNLVAKYILFPDGTPGFRGAVTDVTAEVEALRRVQYLSYHDELTGLPNRSHMKDFLTGQLLANAGKDHPVALISLDLDKFKQVNDTFGHATGDALLAEVSARLKKCIQNGDLASRQGGDEFIVLLDNIGGTHAVDVICRKIIDEISMPYKIHGNEISIGVSLGVALSPLQGNNPSDLLRFADLALYHAKNSGRSTWVYYRSDMSEQLSQRLSMEAELRAAIFDGQLFLCYQPRFNVKDNKIDAVEALVRWLHPLRGILTPDHFIPLAEESGLIINLSDWVLNKACEEVMQYSETISVSVNISAIEFQSSNFADRVKSILEKTCFPAERLEIEVTESVVLMDPDRTFTAMKSLRELGVRFLIDDFGTGYASISYLHNFKFDGIKLDKSFTTAMGKDSDNKKIVESIIDLGKAYCLEVTAEGVENAEQLAFLKAHHCDVVQGYFIGKPVKISELKVEFQ